MLLALALFLTGCAPNDAEVSGQWFAWLPASSSATVSDGKLNLSNATTVDCFHTEDDPKYIGTSDGGPDCDDIAATSYYTFANDDGYYGLTGAIEPWRTEALITSEGDFQITTHVDIGNGEDFRFHWTIAPNFAPVECVNDGSGTSVAQYIDGESWSDEWSADEDGYHIYYLNAGAYQTNPANSDDVWYLTSDWLAGYGVGKFGSDDLSSIASAYEWVDPFASVGVYSSVKKSYSCETSPRTRLFYPGAYFDTKVDASGNDCEYENGGNFNQMVADLEENKPVWESEMTDLMGANVGGEPAFTMKVEDNSWRIDDEVATGLDNWAQVESSWVRLKDGSDISEGGSAEGDFQILYQGTDSGTYVLVTGTWKVDDIKVDKWGYEVLNDELRDSAGTEYCGGSSVSQ